MEFIAGTDQSLSIVDNKYFRNLFDAAGLKLKIPCRQTFTSKKLKSYYHSLKNEIQNNICLHKEVTFCITADCWTNLNNEAFLGLTAHFIDDSFHLQSYTLSLRCLTGSHTGVAISETIVNVLNEWNIKERVKFVCGDNGANMVLAFELLGSIKSIPCSCHCLNLCAKDILDSNVIDTYEQHIKNLVSKCKKIVSSFRHSYLLTESLKEKQKLLNFKNKTKLVQDVPTRWNSTYDMLNSIRKNKTALELIVQESGENSILKTNYPTQHDFIIIDELLSMLQPLKELTLELSCYNFTSCSIIYPSIIGLISFLKKLNVTSSEIKHLKQKLILSIETRFEHILYGPLKEIFISLTFLDIRFRFFEFIEDEIERQTIIEQAKNFIKEFYSKNFEEKTSQAQNTISNDCNQKTNFLKKLMDNRTKVRSYGQIDEEINKYLSYSPDDFSDDPLEYYRKNQGLLTGLCKIVRHFFCITASSVPSECLFSHASQICTDLRNRLDTDNLEMLLLIRDNLKNTN